MASGRVALPATVDAWRAVLGKALALPAAAIHVPPQFAIAHGENGQFLTSFGQPISSARTPRTSGILSVLMPLPSQQPVPSAGTDVAGTAANLRTLASTVSGGGAFLPRGQTRWPDGSFDASTEAFDAPRPFDGIDLVIPVTLRTGSMRAHSAQVSLPGGRCDEGETPAVASRREAVEEVGIDIDRVEMLGETSRLYSFPSQAFVTPCVGIADTFLDVRVASPAEVQSIHFLSLGALVADNRFHQRLSKKWAETGPVNMPCFRTSDGVIVWGLTAFAIGELVSRVGTVLGYTPRLPPGVLKAWGDPALATAVKVRFANPYADALTQPLTKHDRDAVPSNLTPAFAIKDRRTGKAAAGGEDGERSGGDPQAAHKPTFAPTGSKL